MRDAKIIENCYVEKLMGPWTRTCAKGVVGAARGDTSRGDSLRADSVLTAKSVQIAYCFFPFSIPACGVHMCV